MIPIMMVILMNVMDALVLHFHINQVPLSHIIFKIKSNVYFHVKIGVMLMMVLKYVLVQTTLTKIAQHMNVFLAQCMISFVILVQMKYATFAQDLN